MNGTDGNAIALARREADEARTDRDYDRAEDWLQQATLPEMMELLSEQEVRDFFGDDLIERKADEYRRGN